MQSKKIEQLDKNKAKELNIQTSIKSQLPV